MAKHKIAVCGISDCYQPLEKEYKLMHPILKLFKKYKNPIVIITKSTLVLRDKALIADLAKVTDVEIVASVSILDESIRKKTEPCSSPTKDRIEMLKEFKEIGCNTCVLLMPIIPFLTDKTENLDEIFKLVKENKVDNILTSPLHLRGNTKKEFFKFIAEEYPNLLVKFQRLYSGAYVSKEYRERLKLSINKLRIKYNLFYKPKVQKKKQEEEKQLTLTSYK